jgi:hypothetical protein
MSACDKYKEKIFLYFYDELEKDEHSTMESHFQICPDCYRELQRLRLLDQEIPQKPVVNLDESHLQVLRNELSQKIRQREASIVEDKPGFFLFSFITPKPLFQFGFAALLLAFGFLLGNKTSVSDLDQNQIDFKNLISANHQIQAANSEIDPFLAGVEKVKYNPKTGSVEIYYTTINDIQLNGDLNNPTVRQMLTHAMLEEENPTVRLHALKALQVFTDKKKSLTPELVGSVKSLLEKEDNLGVRLQALRLFNQIPLNDSVKNILTKVLLRDPEPAMRIQAFDRLTGENIEQDDIGGFLEIAQKDSNEYLKYRSKVMIDKNKEQKKSKPEKLMRRE